MGVAEASAERYADPTFVGAYLEAEWGDLLDQHKLMPEQASETLCKPCTSHFYKEVAEFAHGELGDSKFVKTACDVGCSTGRFLYEFSKQFQRVTDLLGVEPSEVFTDYARRFLLKQESALSDWIPLPGTPLKPTYVKLTRKFLDSIKIGGEQRKALEIFTGAGEDTPRPEKYFDALFCLNVVDRNPDPKTLIERLGRLVAQGGFFFLASPMDWDKRFTPGEFWVDDLSLLFEKGQWEKTNERDVKYPFRYTARRATDYISQVVCMRKTGGDG
jgi:SAM-dependent methyltransferase